ncbi:ATP-binding protein [Aneurinibacillus sp. Ricciae_BoGa-3]|uniref:ATP-binding protein n=1 Tax=Aneurinibacillus sp. Ricciae_BoGa-3 TaxID=3022697 RepID=UPI002341E713|nr:ATP-binding protein [Aneurinibacillus sp. Ricciae_BoGa-3]WCK53483.1 ATP-binding protein [Aneurinibacillus sp. Ricciae_BoGa-3]
MKERILSLLVLTSATVLFGELKYTPFHSDFRISFGSGVFFFLLLWFHRLPLLFASFLTGVAVVVFRVWLDFGFLPGFSLSSSLVNHVPSFVFYMVFGLILWFGGVYQDLKDPIKMGALGFIADLIANLTELFIRNSMNQHTLWLPDAFYLLSILAFVRSFFVVGFFNIIRIRHLQAITQEQQLRFEKMLMISSELHVEALYLRKVMGHTEQVTRNSYNLYRTLKELEQGGTPPSQEPPLSRRALTIAEEVHEIKKDSQRIVSGMSKIIAQEAAVKEMTVEHIIRLAVSANRKYAEMLGRTVEINMDNRILFMTDKVYSLLSVLNNLLSNAVEAIAQSGWISIFTTETKGMAEFRITDNGVGIPPGDEAFIFKPGYTTKFDEQGNPSTGIGLAHVLDNVNELQGTLHIEREQQPASTSFVIRIPVKSLMKGGDPS